MDFSVGSEPLGQRFSERKGSVAEEANDCRHVPERRRPVVPLPVHDGGFTYAELLGGFLLEETQVQPTLPNMVSYRTERTGVGLGKRFLSAEPETAKRQRRGVPVATWATAASAAVAHRA